MRIAHKILQHLCAAPLALALVGGPALSPARGADPAPAAKPAQKLFTFDMRGKRWTDVLEWLTDQTGLPVMSGGQDWPKGSVTYIPPKGQKYTLPQIIDILNEELIPQKYIIIQ